MRLLVMSSCESEVDKFGRNAVISACDKGQEWERALDLLGPVRRAPLEPDAISCSAGISACSRGARWEQALELPGHAPRPQLDPGVACRGATIAACEKGRPWERALGVLEWSWRSGAELSVISWSEAAGACDASSRCGAALHVWEQLRSSSIVPTATVFNALTCVYDAPVPRGFYHRAIATEAALAGRSCAAAAGPGGRAGFRGPSRGEAELKRRE